MGTLALRYPFAERMGVKNGKYIGLQPSPVIVFSSMNEIEDWRRLVEKRFRVIVDHINWFGSETFAQGFDWKREINLHHKFWKNDPKGYSPETLREFQKIPNEFCLNVEIIYNIARTLDYKLKRVSYLRKLIPSKGTVIITLIGCILAFVSGIVIPVIHPKVSRFLIVWIPTMFYLYFFVYLTIKLFSIVT